MSGIIIADDSGLEVEHLNGHPGVHSKRYSPEATAEANNALLLNEMNGASNRSARFICVMAILNESEHHFIEGICSGTIDTALRGNEGFGYDPLFLPEAYPGRSMAEVSMTKRMPSHIVDVHCKGLRLGCVPFIHLFKSTVSEYTQTNLHWIHPTFPRLPVISQLLRDSQYR